MLYNALISCVVLYGCGCGKKAPTTEPLPKNIPPPNQKKILPKLK